MTISLEQIDLIKKKVAIKVAAHKGASFEEVVLWVIEEWENNMNSLIKDQLDDIERVIEEFENKGK